MYCPNCGKQCEEGTRFCGSCGAELNEAQNTASTEKSSGDSDSFFESNASDPRKESGGKPVKKHRRALWVVLVIAACIVVAGLIIYSLQSSTDRQFHNHMEAGYAFLDDGDYEEAVVEFNSAIQIDSNALEPYQKLAEAYAQLDESEMAEATYNDARNIIMNAYDSATDAESLLDGAEDLYNAAIAYYANKGDTIAADEWENEFSDKFSLKGDTLTTGGNTQTTPNDTDLNHGVDQTEAESPTAEAVEDLLEPLEYFWAEQLYNYYAQGDSDWGYSEIDAEQANDLACYVFDEPDAPDWDSELYAENLVNMFGCESSSDDAVTYISREDSFPIQNLSVMVLDISSEPEDDGSYSAVAQFSGDDYTQGAQAGETVTYFTTLSIMPNSDSKYGYVIDGLTPAEDGGLVETDKTAETAEADDKILSADYEIERQDFSLYSDAGDLAATEYYDLLILSGTGSACEIINDSIDKDYQQAESYAQSFEDLYLELSEGYNYQYTSWFSVDVERVYNANNILSILYKTAYYNAGEVHGGGGPYVLTYNLKTGEKISISDLTDMDDAALLDVIKTNLISQYGDNDNSDDSFSNFVNSLTLDDVRYGFDGSGSLAYYFEDDGEIIILVDQGAFGSYADGIIELPTGVYISVLSGDDETGDLSEETEENSETGGEDLTAETVENLLEPLKYYWAERLYIYYNLGDSGWEYSEINAGQANDLACYAFDEPDAPDWDSELYAENLVNMFGYEPQSGDAVTYISREDSFPIQNLNVTVQDISNEPEDDGTYSAIAQFTGNDYTRGAQTEETVTYYMELKIRIDSNSEYGYIIVGVTPAGKDEIGGTNQTDDEILSVDYYIKQQDYSLYSDAGDLVAKEYYDLVVLYGSNSVCEIINDSIGEDFERAQAYARGLEDMYFELAEEYEYEYASISFVDVEQVYNANGILSILYMTCEYDAGAMYSANHPYVLTYDLNTGEKISISDLTNLDDVVLLDTIKTILMAQYGDNVYFGDSFSNSVDSLTLNDIRYGFDGSGSLAYYIEENGEIIILVAAGGLGTDRSAGRLEVPTGVYISALSKDVEAEDLSTVAEDDKSGNLSAETEDAEAGDLPAETEDAEAGDLPAETEDAEAGDLSSATKDDKSGNLSLKTEKGSKAEGGILTVETVEKLVNPLKYYWADRLHSYYNYGYSDWTCSEIDSDLAFSLVGDVFDEPGGPTWDSEIYVYVDGLIYSYDELTEDQRMQSEAYYTFPLELYDEYLTNLFGYKLTDFVGKDMNLVEQDGNGNYYISSYIYRGDIFAIQNLVVTVQSISESADENGFYTAIVQFTGNDYTHGVQTEDYETYYMSVKIRPDSDSEYGYIIVGTTPVEDGEINNESLAEDWQNLYRDLVSGSVECYDEELDAMVTFKLDSESTYTFALMNLNDDDIPELLVYGERSTSDTLENPFEYHIYTVRNGGLKTVCSGRISSLTLSYLEKGNLFYISSVESGNAFDDVYRMVEDGPWGTDSETEYTLFYSAEQNEYGMSSGMTQTGQSEYTMSNASLTQNEYEDYKSQLHAYFDENKAITPTLVSKEEITAQIENY